MKNDIYKKRLQDAQVIHKRTANSPKISDFRKRWGIHDSTPQNETEFKERERLMDNLISDNDFQKDKGVLMDELKISDRFEQVFLDSLFFIEKIDFDTKLDFSEDRIECYIQRNNFTDRWELILKLSADTKMSDFKSKKLQERIRGLQRKLPDYKSISQRKSDYLKQMEVIYNWKNIDNLTYKEIRRRALDELKYKITSTEDVGVLIQRYKKIVGINTRKRQK